VNTTKNPQNDRLHAHSSTKTPAHTINVQSLMASVGESGG